MAKLTLKAGDEFAIKLCKLATAGDEIAKKAIYAAANIVADEIAEKYWEVVSDEATGATIHSFGIAPIQIDNEGNWNTKIGFDGYDSRGVPNQLKARVMESGSSKQKKRPFVRPAVRSAKKAAISAMGRVIDEEMQKVMK